MPGYTVVLETEKDGGFVVSVPALPGCFTQGDSRDEALRNAREAIPTSVALRATSAAARVPHPSLVFTPRQFEPLCADVSWRLPTFAGTMPSKEVEGSEMPPAKRRRRAHGERRATWRGDRSVQERWPRWE